MTPEHKARMQAGRKCPALQKSMQNLHCLSNLQRQRLKGVPPVYQGLFLKAFGGKSKAFGIKVKCLDCCCYVRSEVERCGATTCPLWLYRPYQKAGEA
jgi:hypothetical protein